MRTVSCCRGQASHRAQRTAQGRAKKIAQGRAETCLDLASQALLLCQLDLTPLGLELLVISMLAQALQQVSLCDPLVSAQGLCDEACKLRVAVCQPATWGHTIGLVLELFWSQVIEVLQKRVELSAAKTALTGKHVLH